MEASLRLDIRTQIRSIVEPTIEAEGFRLIAVEISGDTGGDIVRLYCDGPNFGIDDCATISRAVSPLLDVEDPMNGAYRLEVSSPGIERPVQSPADFERFIGYRAKLRLIPGPERRRYSGTLRGLDGDFILIEVDGVDYRVALSMLDWGHLVLDLDEFTRLQSNPFDNADLQGAQS